MKGVKMIRTLSSTSKKDLKSCTEAKRKTCQISMSSSKSDAPEDKYRSYGMCFYRQYFLVSC